MIIIGGTVFLVVSVSMLNKLRLGVLGVAKITNDCVNVHAVCVAWRTCPYECVCFRLISEFSVFANNYYIFFAFLYPRNLLLGHITKPYLAPVTQ